MNATIEKFGYPATLVREYRHWLVLVRPAQVTAGSLILAAKSEATSYGTLPEAAFTEQSRVVSEIELALKRSVNFDKINYLMLMMVDLHVHFHVLPRYAGHRSLAGMSVTDRGWPGPADLSAGERLDGASTEAVVRILKDNWPGDSDRAG